ncbi:hypothetical protein N7492_009009 [Penicillium capsulatum]|uniref:Myb-like domain-containing protein n=1 Tax=Penicillium capsulatum TaxID=69766 RepID=A0A9W9LGG8_9EURO|nr:hypothetical protein N7492_009009 [Penicillium capsulatum]
MSATLAEQYRGFAINYSTAEKADDHDLIAYDSSESQLRMKLLGGLSFPSERPQTSSYDSPPHTTAALSHSLPQADGHHEPQSSFVQMLPPPQFAYEVHPAQENRKRSRLGSEGADGPGRDRNPGPPQPLHPVPIDAPVAAPEPSDILFPIFSDHATTHPPSSHGYSSPLILPLPQHHHHRLPLQAALSSGSPGFGSEASPVLIGPPSVVGQPGMPEPAPRPRGPKLKFTPDEDALLVDLKEDKNLTWKQIADFFPGRSSGTLQVRYCTKLKAKDVNWSDEMVSSSIYLDIGEVFRAH